LIKSGGNIEYYNGCKNTQIPIIMIQINEHPKSVKDLNNSIPSGFTMTFKNGYSISVQFGWGNYSPNREESKSTTQSAEVAIFDKDDNLVSGPHGWVDADEVATFIETAKNL